MRKYLEITVPDSQRHLARLDYIDFEPMSLPEGYAVWTHPVMEQGVGGVSGYYISLGQPVYIQGMFFGLEFPASETEIEGDRKVRIRYYSGKSFEMLASEGRLADSGTFTTWKEVTGATRSTDMDVIQTDFSVISMIFPFRSTSVSSTIHGMTLCSTSTRTISSTLSVKWNAD